MRRAWYALVQVSGFLRKEVVEVVRQPRLVATLVFGPFLILLLFGIGYKNQPDVLRTMFVGPPGSVYEQVIQSYQGDLRRYVEPRGFTSDQAAAQQALARGDVDLVVVFPDDPVETVLSGKRATITVIHDELDPIQQTMIQFATRLAVNEVNSTVLARMVGKGQETVAPLTPVRTAITSAAARLGQAVATGAPNDVIGQAAAELDTSAGGASALLEATGGLLREFDATATAAQLQQIDDASRTLGEVRAMGRDIATLPPDTRAQRAAALSSTVGQLDDQLTRVVDVDPAVLVQPFEGTTQVALPETVGLTDYFAPAALVLLVQHLGVTFGALTFVRDRMLGLFEILRVGPVGAIQSLSGKLLAYLLIGGVVAGLLAVLVVKVLAVPLVGSVAWVAATLALVLLASLAIGFVASLVAHTDSQAVQFSMILLLASLFFGGFFLDIDRLTYPVALVSLLLPVRYGIAALDDVMLRGQAPDAFELGGLVLLAVAGLLASWALLHRRLRIA